MRANPAEVRRNALKAQEDAERDRPEATRTLRCPDCHDDIDEQRTRDDMTAAGLTVRKPLGWHDCPASKTRRSSQAETNYDWRTHGR